VATGGSLLWRDDLVCGRHGESAGDFRADTTIRYAGSTLYRHELSIGPSAPGWSGAAVLGDGRAIGTLVTAPVPAAADRPMTAWAPHAERGPLTGDFAVLPLPGPGLLATAVGTDIRQVRTALDPLCTPEPATDQHAPTRQPASL
jgi:urease accessory protein